MNKISEEFLLPESMCFVCIDSDVCKAENSGTDNGEGSGGASQKPPVGGDEDDEGEAASLSYF